MEMELKYLVDNDETLLTGFEKQNYERVVQYFESQKEAHDDNKILSCLKDLKPGYAIVPIVYTLRKAKTGKAWSNLTDEQKLLNLKADKIIHAKKLAPFYVSKVAQIFKVPNAVLRFVGGEYPSNKRELLLAADKFLFMPD